MNNYDGSKVGVPYVRVHQITIYYPDGNQLPTFSAKQSMAIKLADGTIRNLDQMPDLWAPLDFTRGEDPVPLVNPADGSDLGASTTLNRVFLGVLAILRAEQVRQELAALPPATDQQP